jgi:hypothetical protein
MLFGSGQIVVAVPSRIRNDKFINIIILVNREEYKFNIKYKFIYKYIILPTSRPW